MENRTQKVTVFGLILGLALMGVPGFLSTALGGDGDTLDLNPGEFSDPKTGLPLSLFLNVDEVNAGRGTVILGLAVKGGGPNLLCSTHGPQPAPGTFPLQGIQCGIANGMPISINRCKAKFEVHGYAHIHHPKVTYLGMVTIEVSFKKRPGLEEGEVKIKVHTPKTTASFKGTISDTDLVSAVDMSSCP